MSVGVHTRIQADILGHENESTTAIYNDMKGSEQLDAFHRLMFTDDTHEGISDSK